MAQNGGLRGDAVLRMPIRARGIELGRPVDLILDLEAGRALGLEVYCGDRRNRFLPLAAASIGTGTISVSSALILLDDLGADFYRERADALRALRGRQVEHHGRRVGKLADVVLGPDAAVRALLVDVDGGEVVVPFAEGPEIAPV